MIEKIITNILNQRNTKEKQIVMGIASIKFRQPIEINYGKKNALKGKGHEDYSLCVPANKKNQINQIRSF